MAFVSGLTAPGPLHGERLVMWSDGQPLHVEFAYPLGRGLPVLVGGVLLGLVVPFTFLGIMPTNRRLEEPGRQGETSETADLLRRWGHLHAVRTWLSLSAFAVLSAHAFGRV